MIQLFQDDFGWLAQMNSAMQKIVKNRFDNSSFLYGRVMYIL